VSKTVITIANQKGGSAKTTTAIHLSAALAEMGNSVLLCDLDAQGHVANYLGIQADELPTEISDVFEGSRSLKEVILKDIRDRLDVAPANIRLADMEVSLAGATFREYRLKRILDKTALGYQFIILDCPPSLGLLTINGLMAADYVLIPMSCEYGAFLGVSRLLQTLAHFQEEGNSSLEVLGLLHTHFRHTKDSRLIVDQTREKWGENVHIFPTPIADSTKFREAARLGKTIFEYAPEIPGARAYREMAAKVLERRLGANG